jgi:hypothetical protein
VKAIRGVIAAATKPDAIAKGIKPVVIARRKVSNPVPIIPKWGLKSWL